MKRDPKINVRGSILAGQQIMGNVILTGQDSVYDIDGIKFDDIKELLKRLESSAQEVIKLHPSLNQ
jgi:hypothetical protein